MTLELRTKRLLLLDGEPVAYVEVAPIGEGSGVDPHGTVCFGRRGTTRPQHPPLTRRSFRPRHDPRGTSTRPT